MSSYGLIGTADSLQLTATYNRLYQTLSGIVLDWYPETAVPHFCPDHRTQVPHSSGSQNIPPGHTSVFYGGDNKIRYDML